VFDFLNAAGTPGIVDTDHGGEVVSAKTTTFPALIGKSLSTNIGFLGPCAQNTPHIHPRSAEFQTMISGDRIRTGIFEENGDRFIQSDLYVGQATIFPKGSIHL